MCKSHKYADVRLTFIALLIAFQTSVFALNYRLDTNVVPDSYDILIRPYIAPEDGSNQYTFDGEVNITLHAVIENLKEITLHKDYIEILSATLHQNNNVVQQISNSDMSFEEETDKLTLKLQEALKVNQSYILQLVYSGQIRNGQAGVFRANYLDEQGNTKTMVLTQAQRIDARTILPCFDEPAFKATFRMRISRPKEYMSIFNTRLINSEVDSNATNRYIDTFDWTPKMSTYLIAFMVAEYTKSGDDDLVIYSRSEYKNFTKFSHSVANLTVEAYNKYTKIPYKNLGNSILQKASSPKFPHNGMENWGLVLYKDEVLVREPGYTDGWNDKQYTITILVHETGHMWFGNSVTFSWWSYFWLNEAFARYYQYYLADEIFPQYQFDEQFVVRQVHLIFGTDALNTTQPLTTPEDLVQSPSQVASKFSAITYAKGASIIRMFRNLMGHDNFDLAIQEYLTEFHLKNVVPSDLFKHLKSHWPKDQFVDLDIFFHDWTEKVGFPMLNVTLSDNKQQVLVYQKRFLLNSTDGSDPDIKYTIPITYTTDDEKDFENLTPKSYFNATDENWIVQMDKPINWIIFNIQQSHYHRVYYAQYILNAIKQALMTEDHSGIHVINRAHILDDIFNFARVNKSLMDYATVFEFAEYLRHETEFITWYAAFNNLERVALRLTVQEQKNFGKFILDITGKVYKKLGFEADNDSVLDVYNRDQVIYWACKYQGPSCIKGAQAALLEANKTNSKPSPDIRETIYCSAVRFGDFNYYTIINNWYKVENRSSEKELLLRSLGCTKHFADYHYARILTDEIPQEYKGLTLKPLYAENPENVSPVFKWITQSYNRLQEQLGSWSALANVISDCASYFTTKDQHNSLDEFIMEHGDQFGDSLVTLQQASRTVEVNLKWASENFINLHKYLALRNSASLKCLSFVLVLVSGILSLLY